MGAAVNSNEQAGSRRVPRGRALRAAVQVSAGAALLLMAAAVVWPLEREMQGAMAGQAQPASAAAKVQAVDAAQTLSRQPRIGQIAIPLHKRRRFVAATATRQDMPYKWQLDSGRIYRPKGESAAPAARSHASRPVAGVPVQPAPNDEPLEAPLSVYGHGGW